MNMCFHIRRIVDYGTYDNYFGTLGKISTEEGIVKLYF